MKFQVISAYNYCIIIIESGDTVARGLSELIELEKEMEEVENSILAFNMQIESLKGRRYELIAHREDLEMQEVIDCAVEAGISSAELMGFVVGAAREKNRKNGILQ